MYSDKFPKCNRYSSESILRGQSVLHGNKMECAAGQTNVRLAEDTEDLEASQTNRGEVNSSRPIKSVVFSQFTSMLNLVGDALR